MFLDHIKEGLIMFHEGLRILLNIILRLPELLSSLVLVAQVTKNTVLGFLLLRPNQFYLVCDPYLSRVIPALFHRSQ